MVGAASPEVGMFSLDTKVAVVTGGGSGIGLAVVHRLAEAGAAVVIGDVTPQDTLAAEVGGHSVVTDVADDHEVAELMETTVRHLGRIDIVVNNAGVALAETDTDITSVDDATYLRLFEVNALGVAHGMKHAAPRMTDGGSIINVSSLAGAIGFPGFPAYAMSKAGVIGLTRVAALQLAATNIRVNAVCPGFVDTPMARDDPVDYARFSEAVVPLGRLVAPQEVAAAIHFLASDDAAMITGQIVNVGGGLSAGVSAQVVDQALDERIGPPTSP
jgi:NAD(P)-dependent dehydrogenase (short-subunit alcohol dehydrogenase family)